MPRALNRVAGRASGTGLAIAKVAKIRVMMGRDNCIMAVFGVWAECMKPFDACDACDIWLGETLC